MSDPTDEVLHGKYPAKAHIKKVLEYITANGGDASGVIYLEGQKTKMNEVRHMIALSTFLWAPEESKLTRAPQTRRTMTKKHRSGKHRLVYWVSLCTYQQRTIISFRFPFAHYRLIQNIGGGTALIRNRQRRYFFYLTGCELPDCYFTYDIAAEKSTLFIPPINPEEVVWSGLPMTAEEALKK